MSVTLEITPIAFNIQPYCNFFESWDLLSGFRLELFSPDLCVVFFSFKVPIYNFRCGKAFQCIYYGVDDKYLVAKLLPRRGFSPVFSTNWSQFAALLCIDNVGINKKFFNLVIQVRPTPPWISFLLCLGQRDNSSPWWQSLVSLMYVLVLRLRWPDETS